MAYGKMKGMMKGSHASGKAKGMPGKGSHKVHGGLVGGKSTKYTGAMAK